MKELIKTIALVLVVAAVVYFFFEVEKVNSRMDILNSRDSTHSVTIVDFDHNLNDLSLEFVGRGKHIQQFQQSLKEMDAKLDSSNMAISDMIEETNTSIAELKMDLESRLTELKTDQDDVSERLNKFQRETQRTLTDLQSAITRIGREFGDLDKRVKTLETPPTTGKK
ncbi:MAG: hypothetical protein M0R34_03760 [Candidatus Marinimicrobia bacterium]|nr:hypothetical protein [Candidatus Neomarinimicrobiota bacterium]MDD5061309.1 hypothetical protein [Candidatus Neomarinimicrobiota bacterium]MDD5539979.1 hypothetical protein [Candidatus Neomarinimicrobiota bacterium]